MAGRWQAVSEILERGDEGEEGLFGRLLLLEGRTAVGPELAAVGRDGGDPSGIGRPCLRVLYDTYRHATGSEYADGRCLLARRPRGHEYPGRIRRSETGGADGRTSEKLEVDQKRLTHTFQEDLQLKVVNLSGGMLRFDGMASNLRSFKPGARHPR